MEALIALAMAIAFSAALFVGCLAIAAIFVILFRIILAIAF